MNVNLLKTIGLAAIIALLAVAYNVYSSSVENDFNDISRAEAYRMGDHYTGFYHRPGCPKLQQTYGGGIRFESSEAARKEGYNPCKRCDPDGPDDVKEVNDANDVKAEAGTGEGK